MDENAASNAHAPLVHAALRDYEKAPGKYQIALRQPAVLFDSVREVLQLAAGRDVGNAGSTAELAQLSDAARFFTRTALLYPGADHYAVFGLERGAEPVELKERYRLLMRLTHPDFRGDDEHLWPADAAVRVNRAYEVLSSPVLRKEYDEQLASPKAPPQADRPSPSGAVTRATRSSASEAARGRLKTIVSVCVVGGIALAIAGLIGGGSDPAPLVQRPSATATVVAASSKPRVEPTVPAPTPSVASDVAPQAAKAAPSAPERADGPGGPATETTAPAAPPPLTVAEPPMTATAPAKVAMARSFPPLDASPEPLIVRRTAARPAPALATAPTPVAAHRGDAPPLTVAAAASLRPARLIGPEIQRQADPVAPVAELAQSAKPTPPAAPEVALAPAPEPPPVPPASPAAAKAPPPAPVASTVPSPALRPGPTLKDAQPLLATLLQHMESGKGEELLRLLDPKDREKPSAVALSELYDSLVKGARPVRLTHVDFKAEPADGRLFVIGRVRLHAGEPTIGSMGSRIALRAEFASRDGKVVLTGLSSVPN